MTKATKVTEIDNSDVIASLVAKASNLGYNVRSAFQAAVDTVMKLALLAENEAQFDNALGRFATAYKSGYIAFYLEDREPAKRNLNQKARVTEALEIMALPTPDSKKKADARRTDVQHKACRAADKSLADVKRSAGLKPTKGGGKKGANTSGKAKGEKDTPASGTEVVSAKDEAKGAIGKPDVNYKTREGYVQAMAGGLLNLLTMTEKAKQHGAKVRTAIVPIEVENIIRDCAQMLADYDKTVNGTQALNRRLRNAKTVKIEAAAPVEA